MTDLGNDRSDGEDGTPSGEQVRPRYENQSIERAFALLEAIGEGGKAYSLAEIVERTRLDRATAYRLLTVLVRLRYVHKDLEAARYSLGFGVFKLGRHRFALATVTRQAAPFVRRLSAELDATVHLGALEGSQAVYYDKVEGASGVRVPSQIGTYVDAHATALGKALLAHRPPRAVDQLYLSAPLRALTPHTITTRDRLHKDLARIRERGWAEDAQEFSIGLQCIAVPVINPLGIANLAISVSGSTEWFSPERHAHVVERVRAAARDLAQHIIERDLD